MVDRRRSESAKITGHVAGAGGSLTFRGDSRCTLGQTRASKAVLPGEAGWIPVRYELMTGTNHYIVIFVQNDLYSTEPESKDPLIPFSL